MRITYCLLLCIIFCSNLISQIESNEYFEAFHSFKKAEENIGYIGNGLFIVTSKDPKQKSYLKDTLGNIFQSPCQKLVKGDRLNLEETDYYHCHQDTTTALYSISKKKLVTPFSQNLKRINDEFYQVIDSSHIDLYTMENELVERINTNLYQRTSFQNCIKGHVIMYHSKGRKVFNKNGEISNDRLCYSTRSTFSNGYILFQKNKKYGVESPDGEVIIPAHYDKIKEWIDGKFIVSINVLNEKNTRSTSKTKSLSGVVDSTGKLILPIEYSSLSSTNFGLISGRPKCKKIFLNSSFEDVYKQEFDVIRNYETGLIILKNEDKTFYDLFYDSKGWELIGGIKSGKKVNHQISMLELSNGNKILINRVGGIIYDPKVAEVKYEKFNNGLVLVENNFIEGLIDENGKWFVELSRSMISKFKTLGGVLVKFHDDKPNYLLNSEGKVIANNVTTATLMEPIHAFILSKQDKSGVINNEGDILIPFEYDKIRELRKLPGYYRIIHNGFTSVVKVKNFRK